MALPLAPLLMGGLGVAALARAMKKNKKKSQDARAMEVGDVTGQPSGMAYGGKVKKMAMGGSCRGMGAAKRGGNFKMA